MIINSFNVISFLRPDSDQSFNQTEYNIWYFSVYLVNNSENIVKWNMFDSFIHFVFLV